MQISKELMKKRKRTVCVYNIVSFLMGLESSCVIVSLMYYLEHDVGVSRPRIFSSIVMALYTLSSSISAVIAGRYADKTRKVKKIILFILFLSTFGNLIYTINNVWCVIIGRLICGCLTSITSSLSAELSKTHDEVELGSALYILQSAMAVGYTIGPATAGLFTGINFSITTSWKITQNNFIGIFMAVSLVITTVLTLNLVTDISRNMDAFTDVDAEDEKPYKNTQSLTVSLFGIILLLNIAMKKILSRPKNNVLAYTILVFSLSISCWFMVLPKLIDIHFYIIQFIFISIPLLLNAVSLLGQNVISRQILFRLIPVDSRTYTDGLRTLFCKILMVIAYLSSGFIFSYMEYFLPCFIAGVLSLYYLLFLGRELYNNSDPSLKKYRIFEVK